MTRSWETIETVETAAGPLTLRRRGERDFLILQGTRVLMTSTAHRSEQRLAECACAEIRGRSSPRLLIGGLGMGYTLRAALDVLGPGAKVVVAELEGAVVRWCRGPLASLTSAAVDDPRVAVWNGDVAAAIAVAAERGPAYDAIALDLFEGPRGDRAEAAHPLYGDAALSAGSAALRPGGVLAIWSETPARGFERRLAAAGFSARTERAGRGGRRHAIHVAKRR